MPVESPPVPVDTERRVLWATLPGIGLYSFPAVVMVASLPAIARDLGTTERSLAWVVTLPALAASATLPLFGRFGDLHGHRRVFLAGFALSGITSGLAALAWNPASLVFFRTLSHASGAATSPTGTALLLSSIAGERRARALGYWTLVMALAPTLGLLFGGPAIDATSWRVLFAFQAVAVFVALPLCASGLDETPRQPVAGFDLPGVAALMLASGAAVFGLDRGGRWGWTHPGVLATLALVPIGVVLFREAERRARSPLLPLNLVHRPNYATACSAELLFQLSTNAMFILMPLALADHFDAGVGETSLLMLPLPIGMSALSPVGGRLAQSIGERLTTVIGSVVLCGGAGLFLVGDHERNLVLVLLSLLLVGGANGLARPAYASAAGSDLDPEFYGAGMATMRTLSVIGAAGGISLGVSLLSIDGYRLPFLLAAGVALACAVTSARLRPLAHAPTPASAAGAAWPADL